MVAYVVWAIDLKSEVRSCLQGCLEAMMALKPNFLCLCPIDGSFQSSSSSTNTNFYKIPQKLS